MKDREAVAMSGSEAAWRDVRTALLHPHEVSKEAGVCAPWPAGRRRKPVYEARRREAPDAAKPPMTRAQGADDGREAPP
jgi:hypothetical protein